MKTQLTRTALLAVALVATGTSLVATAPAYASPAMSRPPHRLATADPTTFTAATRCSPTSTYKVPAGVTAVQIDAAGANGADGTYNASLSNGGKGAKVRATIGVVPGSTLYVQVGAPGIESKGGPGAGDGGTYWSYNPNKNKNGQFVAGGGGGASGVSPTPDCGSWLLVAGGGGGGGSGDLSGVGNHEGHGGIGGDGCLPGTTCSGATKGTTNSGATSGNPGGVAPNATPGSAEVWKQASATAGKSPSGMQGGSGGGGPVNNLQDDSYSDAIPGGGGGEGFIGGSGGGGGLAEGSSAGGGGGGGGGTSYVSPAGHDTTTSVNSASDRPSVTITPVQTTVVLQSADNGQVLNIPGGVSDDGTRLIQWPREGGGNEMWNLKPDTDGSFEIVNPDTSKCVTVGGDSYAGYPMVDLVTCGSVNPKQTWDVTWLDNGTVSITNAGRVLSITDSAKGAPVVVAPDDGKHGTANTWSVVDSTWPTE